MKLRQGEVQYGIRLPAWIVAELKVQAERQRRSLNGQIVAIFETYLAKQGVTAPEPPKAPDPWDLLEQR